MRVITVANQKGGSGKTTTALALAQAGKAKGFKMLCIDVDAQGNLSTALGANPNCGNSYDFITGAKKIRDCIQETAQGIYLIAGSFNLSALKTSNGSAMRLQKAMKDIQGGYDLCIIDCPPNMGEAQFNALQASSLLVIPLQASVFDTQGLYVMVDTARQFSRTNPALTIAGYVLTAFDGRSKLSKTLEEKMKAEAESQGVEYLGSIRRGVAVREAQALSLSLYEYAPNSNPAKDYMDIFDKLTKKIDRLEEQR